MSNFYSSYPVSGGNGVVIYSTFSAFPLSAPTGTLAVAADTGIVYEFNGTVWVPVGGPSVLLSIGSPANGLSISSNALSLALASTSTTGALSSTDWNTFNNKQAAGNYATSGSGDVTWPAHVGGGPVTTSLTATTNSTITTLTALSLPYSQVTGGPTAGANTSLSNLTTTSINQDLLPDTDNGHSIGGAALSWSSAFINSIISGDQNQLTLVTQAQTAVNSGGVLMASGNATGASDNSGNVSLFTGNSSHATSGNILLSPGTGTTRGKIVFQDGSQGIAGNVWTSSNTSGAGHWAPGASASTVNTGIFGDGSTGAGILDGTNTYSWANLVGSTYTLTQTVYLNNLTINSGITLVPSGYFVFCSGTLSNAGTIDNSGAAGSAGVASVGGTGGLGGGSTGGLGFAEINPAQAGQSAINSDTTSSGASLNGLGGGNQNAFIISGGSGGSGGTGTVGAGGTGGATGTGQFLEYRRLSVEFPATISGGSYGAGSGAAGAGDGVNPGGAGGGAGGGGATLFIFAAVLNNTGTIQSLGGAGGAGESVTVGNCGGGGGGGGGAGGVLYLVSNSWLSAGTLTVTGAAGGALGTGHGSGTNGTAGTAGGTGIILKYNGSSAGWF